MMRADTAFPYHVIVTGYEKKIFFKLENRKKKYNKQTKSLR